MPTATNKTVSAAIKKATGYDIKLFKADGCVSFYSDDDDTMDMLMRFQESCVYVNAISHMSVEQWVSTFQWLLEENKDYIEKSEDYEPSDIIILNYNKKVC